MCSASSRGRDQLGYVVEIVRGEVVAAERPDPSEGLDARGHRSEIY